MGFMIVSCLTMAVPSKAETDQQAERMVNYIMTCTPEEVWFWTSKYLNAICPGLASTSSLEMFLAIITAFFLITSWEEILRLLRERFLRLARYWFLHLFLGLVIGLALLHLFLEF